MHFVSFFYCFYLVTIIAIFKCVRYNFGGSKNHFLNLPENMISIGKPCFKKYILMNWLKINIFTKPQKSGDHRK